MYVNAGGDPGRDDYGLPPVDIEIPDDARELARDVLAYRRELRSRRRRRLARRFSGPLTRDGMVLPLLAGCLALTLVAATLLTVFTARQPMVSPRPPRAATSSSSGAASPAPAVDPKAAALMNTTLFAAGVPEPLTSLPGPVLVLALIPRGCRCLHDLRELAIQALRASTPIYLVGVRDAPVRSLTADLDLGATMGLEDSRDLLPAPYRVAALTAVLVRTDGSAVRVVPDHGQGFDEIEKYVRALRPGSAAQPGTASASPAVPTSAAPTPAGPAASGSPAASAPPAGQ
jgi:hypothetical protein